jgi:hypothetical protein
MSCEISNLILRSSGRSELLSIRFFGREKMQRSRKRLSEPGWIFVIGIVLLVGAPTFLAAWNIDLIIFLTEVYLWSE